MKAIIINPFYFTIELREIAEQDIQRILAAPIVIEYLGNRDVVLCNSMAPLISYAFFTIQETKVAGIGIIVQATYSEVDGKQVIVFKDCKSDVKDIKPHWYLDIGRHADDMREVKVRNF